jgi:hypothetical protein
MVVMQDAAVTALAIAGVAILARKIIGSMRPKADPKCDHCPTGAAVTAKHHREEREDRKATS